MVNSQSGDGSDKAHMQTGKRKRIVTVARKEQNREAQRVYRERQKLRQQALREKQREVPSKPLELRPRLTSPSDEPKDTLHLNNDSGSCGVQGSWVPMTLELDNTLGASTNSSCVSASYAASNSVQIYQRRQSLDSSSALLRPELPLVWPSGMLETSGPLPSAHTSCPLLHDTWPGSDAQSYSNQQTTGLLISPFPYSMSGELVGSVSSTETTVPPMQDQSMSAFTQQPQAYRNAGVCSVLLSTPSEPPLDAANSTAQANPYHLGHANNVEPFADPYLNTLQLSFSRTFSAFLHNASSLGFSINDLLGGGGSGGCDCGGPGFQSPFYRADAASHCNPSDLLAAAITSRPSIPLHLRPTLPQILFPHHAFLDLLPFPTLRARAITLSAAKPHAFDAMRLKRDIYVHQALVCWLERDLSEAQGSGIDGHAAAQPWNMRSWKVAPWFLRKWRMLISGEEGELWKGAV